MEIYTMVHFAISRIVLDIGDSTISLCYVSLKALSLSIDRTVT